MASVKFEGGKCKGAVSAKAYLRHDKRESEEHANQQIDKSRSHLNWSVYGLSYKQACEKYDKRIKELDSSTNTNKRKDRVTMFALVVPCPVGIPENDQKRWFRRVTDILIEQYGENNLIDADVHVDEVHSYTDANTKQQRTSLIHAHFNFVPEHEGKLNGKWFSNKRNINMVNQTIQQMSIREFGVQFMDGSKKKSKDTVETLKNKSLQAQNDKLQEQVIKARERLSEAQKTYSQYKQANNQLKADNERLQADNERLKKQLSRYQGVSSRGVAVDYTKNTRKNLVHNHDGNNDDFDYNL